MRIVRIPWSDVLPWSVVLVGGEPAVVLPPRYIGAVTVQYRRGQPMSYPGQSGHATIVEPDLGDALRNLLTHFTLEDVSDG